MKKRSLGLKLNLIITFSTLIMLMTLLSLYIAIYERGINEQMVQYASEELENVKVLLDDYLSDLMDSAETMAAQADIINFMTLDTSARLSLTNTVKSALASYVHYKQGVMQMYLRSREGTRIASNAGNTDASISDVFQIYRDIQSRYDLSLPFKKSYMTELLTTAQGKNCFGMLIPVHQLVAAPKDSDYLGCLVVICGTEGLSSMIPVSTREKLLVTQGDTIVFSGNDTLSAAWNDGRMDPVQEENAETSYQILTDTLSVYPWTVHVLAVSDNIEDKLQEVQNLCVILGVLLIIIQCIILVLSYHAFVRPIVGTVSQIKLIRSMQERIIPPKNAGKELDALIREMNNLLERNEQLNAMMLQAELKHYKEKIIFLQAQINPHFLYNNLQCIRGMAASGNSEAIREMASCIAAIYRYGCRDGATATLSEELACIQNYTRIIDLRYGSTYDIQIVRDEECLSCFLPRMTLQPLVENCIVHGFEMASKEGGRIVIHAQMRGSTLCVSIQDNGCGMDQETLRRINTSRITEADKIKHLGIANIRTRIELLFGPESSLQLTSGSTGTTAEVMICQTEAPQAVDAHGQDRSPGDHMVVDGGNLAKKQK